MGIYSEQIAVILKCEGMGDCLFAIPIIRKLLSLMTEKDLKAVIFTHHPN